MVWSHRTAKTCKLVKGERQIIPCPVESSKGDNVYLGIVGNVVLQLSEIQFQSLSFTQVYTTLSTHLLLIVSCIYLPHG